MIYFHLFILAILATCSLQAAGPSSSAFPSESSKPGGAATPPAPPPPPPSRPSPPLVKPLLPMMLKPYGMPGVVGLQHGRWVGSDYLGYLSRSISVDVEIVKSNQVPNLIPSEMLESKISAQLSKADFIPAANVQEGPPLPFLQVLLIIYPVKQDEFVLFGACRLFERMNVIRERFTPAGYWQGITWEAQDILKSSLEDLRARALHITERLVDTFIKRYQAFNPSPEYPSEDLPSQ